MLLQPFRWQHADPHGSERRLGRSIGFGIDGFASGLTDVIAADVLLLFSAEECQALLGGEAAVLLHHPLPCVGVSTGI